MSGGTTANAERFFKENGLYDFYYGLGGPYRGASWGVYALGARTLGGPAYGFTWTGGSRIRYPDECYLPVKPRGADRVIDFSNPLTIKLERERAFQGVVGHEKETGRMEQDYADSWDKWPGQYDPYMRALEPGMPVRPLGAR
jgi:hypothetical protein